MTAGITISTCTAAEKPSSQRSRAARAAASTAASTKSMR
jgi:hypothetical protein